MSIGNSPNDIPGTIVEIRCAEPSSPMSIMLTWPARSRKSPARALPRCRMTVPAVDRCGSPIHLKAGRIGRRAGRRAADGRASWMGGGVSASPPCRASTTSSHHWIAVSRSVKSESSRAAPPEQRLGVQQRGHAPLRDQFVAQARDQAGRDVADVLHAAAVDQQRVEVVGAFGDLAHRDLGTGEEQVAVQFVHPSRGARSGPAPAAGRRCAAGATGCAPPSSSTGSSSGTPG